MLDGESPPPNLIGQEYRQIPNLNISNWKQVNKKPTTI
jgi:hypothetical protein